MCFLCNDYYTSPSLIWVYSPEIKSIYFHNMEIVLCFIFSAQIHYIKLPYSTNFWWEKTLWQIWQMDVNSPKFSNPNIISALKDNGALLNSPMFSLPNVWVERFHQSYTPLEFCAIWYDATTTARDVNF